MENKLDLDRLLDNPRYKSREEDGWVIIEGQSFTVKYANKIVELELAEKLRFINCNFYITSLNDLLFNKKTPVMTEILHCTFSGKYLKE